MGGRCGIGERGHIDLDHRAEPRVFLGEVALGQQGLVQGVGDGPGPVDVERFPVPPRGQRRVKMVEQGHGDLLPSAGYFRFTIRPTRAASALMNSTSRNGSAEIRWNRTLPWASIRKVPCSGWFSKSSKAR